MSREENPSPSTRRALSSMEPEPISEPIQPWVTPEPPRKPWIERFGPAAAVLALMLALILSAWKSLTPPEPVGPRLGPIAANVIPPKPTAEPKLTPNPDLETESNPVAKSAEMTTPPDTNPAKSEAAESEKESSATKSAPPSTAETKAASATTSLPAGAVGKAEKPDGVLLRYNTATRCLGQIDGRDPPEGAGPTLESAPVSFDDRAWQGEGGARGRDRSLGPHALPKQAAHLSLSQGRLVLHGTTPAAPFAVQFAKKTLEITPPSDTVVGLERFNRREAGSPVAADPYLKVFASEGEVALAAGDAKESLTAPATINLEARGNWSDRESTPAPAWVVDPKPTPYDLQLGAQFLKYFKTDKQVLNDLVEAMEDEQRDIRRLTVSALRATGDVSFIVPLLSKEDPVSRRGPAIAVLHAFLGQGPEASRELQVELQKQFGDDLGPIVEKLLVGYTAKETRKKRRTPSWWSDSPLPNSRSGSWPSTTSNPSRVATISVMTRTARKEKGEMPGSI